MSRDDPGFDLDSEVARAKKHFVDLLGELPGPIASLETHAPQALAGYMRTRDFIYTDVDEGGLDLKTKELIYVVLDTATGNLAGAKNHLGAAMRAGLTVPELAQALIQVMTVCGITTWGQTGYFVLDHAADLAAKTTNEDI
ncbi:MAG: carboxymuconolactone decarboxylase family protein [Azospirillaceae bacterium]